MLFFHFSLFIFFGYPSTTNHQPPTFRWADLIDAETSDIMQQYYNDDAFYIAENRVYQSSNDEFAGMFGPIQTVAG